MTPAATACRDHVIASKFALAAGDWLGAVTGLINAVEALGQARSDASWAEDPIMAAAEVDGLLKLVKQQRFELGVVVQLLELPQTERGAA